MKKAAQKRSPETRKPRRSEVFAPFAILAKYQIRLKYDLFCSFLQAS
jgi:hypothetical protein